MKKRRAEPLYEEREMKERILTLADFVIKSGSTVRHAAEMFGVSKSTVNKATVRAAAKEFGISKSTVHKDLSQRLETVDPVLYEKVRRVLDKNKAERHIRGGLATRRKYLGGEKKNRRD